MATNAGKLLHGQLFETEKNIIRQFTQQEMDKDAADLLLGNARTEITPTDRGSSEVKVWTDVTAAILNLTDEFGGYTNLNGKLPDVLTGISVTYNESKGEGQYTEDAVGTSGGSSSSSLSFNLNGSAQSNFSIIADVNIETTRAFYPNVKTRNFLFYLASDATEANVIARLALPPFNLTVLPWPTFRVKSHTITITGQSMDIRVNTKVDQSSGASAGNSFFVRTAGRGYSLSGGVSVRSIEIPPTIHSQILISGAERTGQASATSITTIIGGLNFPGYQELLTKETPVQRARVFPAVLNPTSPSSIPTSGLYLLDIISQKDTFDLNKVQAIVVDFSTI